MSKTEEATEVAAQIDAHLKRMEGLRKADSKIGLYGAGAHRDGRFISVTYITYQGSSKLCLDAAKHYLASIEKNIRSSDYRHQQAFAGTQWDRDPTGLRSAARSRSKDRYAEKEEQRRIDVAVASAERDAVGMEIAAKHLVGMARSAPDLLAGNILTVAAKEIRKLAKDRVLAAKK